MGWWEDFSELSPEQGVRRLKVARSSYVLGRNYGRANRNLIALTPAGEPCRARLLERHFRLAEEVVRRDPQLVLQLRLYRAGRAVEEG